MLPVLGLQFFDVLQAFDGFFVEGSVNPLADKIIQGYAEGVGYFFAASMEGTASPRSYLPIISLDTSLSVVSFCEMDKK